MDVSNKRQAEEALHALFIGTQIVGVRWFAGNFVILLGRVKPLTAEVASRLIAYDELLLTVESRWVVFPAPPDRFPRREEDLPVLSLEERVSALARLADQDIISVALGEQHPHLVLTFASGSILFLNGYHDTFESWNVSTVGAPEVRDWLIIAVPEGEVTTFAPHAKL